jgi:hypothetical protein
MPLKPDAILCTAAGEHSVNTAKNEKAARKEYHPHQGIRRNWHHPGKEQQRQGLLRATVPSPTDMEAGIAFS